MERVQEKDEDQQASLRFPFLLLPDRVKWKGGDDFSVRTTSVNVYHGEAVHCGHRLKGDTAGPVRTSSAQECSAELQRMEIREKLRNEERIGGRITDATRLKKGALNARNRINGLN